MSKYLCLLISLILVLGLGLPGTAFGAKDPDLVGWWWFDEGAGTVAADSSNYGNHGALVNGGGWAPGYFGTAVSLDGDDDFVEVPHNDTLLTDDEATVMAWINTPRLETPGQGYQGVIAKGNGTARSYSLYTTPSGMHFSTGPGGAYIGSSSTSGALPTNEWVHVCAMIVDGGHAYFVNGEPAGTGGAGAVGPGAADTENVVIGRTQEGTNRSFLGLIDDARIYVRGLTQAEIQQIMTGDDLQTTLATNPIPAEDQIDVQRDIVLSWNAGELAATHDVYLGTTFDDVNDASRSNPMGVLVSQGQAATTYDPEGLLEIGQTYYWRIDEVNAAPDNTIFKGSVWSFTAEPLAYPIEGVIATTNATYEATAGPENTINGSGINADNQHSTEASEMFLGSGDAGSVYLQYEFDGVYKLHEMLVWNYNVQFEILLGFGMKDVTIEYSENGVDWTVLAETELAQATARADYTANTTVDFGGVAAQFVRITINSAWGTRPQYGLSEVRFMYIPATAREPQPADGATNVAVDSALAWRAGRDAVSHEISFGPDEQAVADGSAVVATVDTSSYMPGDLNLATDYFWKVKEIQDAEAWDSNVWSFSTQDYLVVEDFESYNDDTNVIYDTWIDGWVNETGSTVGYLVEPFAEQTIVHGGRQSMPLFYDNAGVSTAEAEYAVGGQNWTANGIQSFSLYFAGASGNDGQLYVKINNTRVDYDGDAANITRPGWQVWNIDLSTVGGNLGNVTNLTIGIAGSGAQGTVYIDDIRLYPDAPQFITPVEPDAAGLVASYSFEGNANDGSGNGHDGTAVGNVTFVNDPARGQVVSLPGGDDQYISIEGVGIRGTMPRTIACWAKADNTSIPDWTLIFGFTGTETGEGGNGSHFNIGSLGGPGGVGAHVWGWEETIFSDQDALEWHHYAMTYDGTTIQYYGDGIPMDTDTAKSNVQDLSISWDRVHVGSRITQTSSFPGDVDDAVIYDSALSDAEIAWLAGNRMPVHKPF